MQIVLHTVDAVYLRKESQMLTNALRNHSQSLLDGAANMYTPHHTTNNRTAPRGNRASFSDYHGRKKMTDFS